MLCPDCDKELGYRAICGCGWKKPVAPKIPYEKIPAKCCYDVCNFDAICRIKTATGWANVCEKHYLAHFQKPADDYAESMGLVTLAKKRQFVREKAASVYRMREPGDDDEVAA